MSRTVAALCAVLLAAIALADPFWATMRITTYEAALGSKVPIRGKLLKTLKGSVIVQVWVAKDRKVLDEINQLRRTTLRLTSDGIQRTTFAARSSTTTGMTPYSLQLILQAINWDASTIELDFTLIQSLRGDGEELRQLWKFADVTKVKDHVPVIYLVRYGGEAIARQSVIVFDVARERHREH